MRVSHNLPLIALMALCCNSTTREKHVPAPDADGSVPAITEESKDLPLDRIKMPAGFVISVYAEVEDARSMTMSPGGVLYVGNRDGSSVYAIKDFDADGKGDKKWTVATGLNSPNGVAYKDGDLYIAEISNILKLSGIDSKLAK